VSDSLDELERQVERGNLFAHTVLSQHATRANDGDALINGLVALLVQRGLVDADELMAAIDSARTELERSGRGAGVDVALRVDKEGPTDSGVEIDCASRIPYCRAACCRFHFPLSVEEIESGPLKWDLGKPYFNRHGPDGYCHQFDGSSGGCGIYEQRPAPCRQYSCVDDTRVWLDFDAMVPNTAWLEEHLANADRGPIELFIEADGAP
jgi:Fe-S-cluster containining protein